MAMTSMTFKTKAFDDRPLEPLYDQLNAVVQQEQSEFADWLMQKKPSEILTFADEYAKREDIVYAISQASLPREKVVALLNALFPVAEIYNWYARCEAATGEYMSQIYSFVDDVAKKHLSKGEEH